MYVPIFHKGFFQSLSKENFFIFFLTLNDFQYMFEKTCIYECMKTHSEKMHKCMKFPFEKMHKCMKIRFEKMYKYMKIILGKRI